MKDKLNAGVIGLGVGESHILGLQSHPRCEVIALCDLNKEVLKKVGQKYPKYHLTNDPISILDDARIDLVCLASFDNFHEEQVLRALRNNKHVFVEKPLCLSIQELINIKNQLNSQPHLSLSSNHILRKTPRFIELRDRIASGQLGEIFHMEGSYDYGRLDKLTNGWRGRIPNYSVTLGGGIHIIDMMLWISGKKVSMVFAQGNNEATSNSQFEGHSLTTSTIKFEDGTTGQLTSNYASFAPHHHKLCVYGTSGTFEQAHCGSSYYWSKDPLEKTEVVSSDYPGAVKGDLIADFIDSIFSGKPPIIPKQEVLDAISVCLAIDKSISLGTPQKVVYEKIL